MLIQTFLVLRWSIFQVRKKEKVSGPTNDHMYYGLLVTSGSNRMILRKRSSGRCKNPYGKRGTFCTATCRGSINAHQSQQVLNENVWDGFPHLPWMVSRYHPRTWKIGVCIQIVITKNNPVENNPGKNQPSELKKQWDSLPDCWLVFLSQAAAIHPWGRQRLSMDSNRCPLNWG